MPLKQCFAEEYYLEGLLVLFWCVSGSFYLIFKQNFEIVILFT